MMSVLAPLKPVRNAVADSAASLVVRAPALEPAFRAAGRIFSRIPLVETVYRRASDTLVARWAGTDALVRRVRIGGIDMWFDVSSFPVRDRYFKGQLYEARTTRWILDHVKPGDTFVDVGAFDGYYTILAALLAGPLGRVVAFEPNPSVLPSLRRHIEVNGCADRVSIEEVALTDHTGCADLFVPDVALNPGLSSIDPVHAPVPMPDAQVCEVRCETLDEWRKRTGFNQVDVVKIDVEGAEGLVLRGMTTTLAEAPPRAIICETSWDGQLHQWLTARGYQAHPLDRWGFGQLNILYVRDVP